MTTLVTILILGTTSLATGAGCSAGGLGCPATGSSTFTPESLEARIHFDASEAIPVGAPLRLEVSAIENGRQQTCVDGSAGSDTAASCCRHVGSENAARNVTATIVSVSCEGPCTAWVDPADPGFIRAVGSEVGTGTLVAKVASEGFSTTVRLPIAFDVAQTLTFTQLAGISSATYVYLEGDSFTWCAHAIGRSGTPLAAESIDVVTSGPITAGKPFNTNATGHALLRTCAQFDASAKGHATVDWTLAGIRGHQDVDIVSLDDVRTIELVTYPQSPESRDWALDEDRLQGVGPSAELSFPVLPCPGPYPTLAVRFAVDGGRTGLAPRPVLTVDPPDLLRIDPVQTFISASGSGGPGTTGVLTARVGPATTRAGVKVATCGQRP